MAKIYNETNETINFQSDIRKSHETISFDIEDSNGSKRIISIESSDQITLTIEKEEASKVEADE